MEKIIGNLKKQLPSKLRIVKSNHSKNWYANSIGEEFEIIGSRGVNEFKIKRTIGDNWFVNSMDVKTI